MYVNKALILGNLTRDPELKTTPSGQSVAQFGVATNRVWNNKEGQRQEEVEFHNIVVWGRLAEIAGRYLTKGKLVFIEGRIKTRTWEDQQTGQKRSRMEIVADNFQMGPGGGTPKSDNNQQQSEDKDDSEQNKQENLPVIDSDEDLPF